MAPFDDCNQYELDHINPLALGGTVIDQSLALSRLMMGRYALQTRSFRVRESMREMRRVKKPRDRILYSLAPFVKLEEK
jgi:hypothetical protein